MKKQINILAIDDHKASMMGYKYILQNTEFTDIDINIETATSYEEALQKIKLSKKEDPIDIYLVDVELDNDYNELDKSGLLLGKTIREVDPHSKIIFVSVYEDNYHINKILSYINPDGYVVKSDISSNTFKEMIESTLNNVPYYSSRSLLAIRRFFSGGLIFTQTDADILYCISIGKSITQTSEQLSKSQNEIEERMAYIKNQFAIQDENDALLINAAKSGGII